ncbi:MAG: tetratricopeptide repeat protein [Bacteroidia bacterium]
MRIAITPCILFLLLTFSFAGQLETDSLKNQLHNATSIDKININYAIAFQFENSLPDSALAYYEKGLKLAEASGNDTLIAKGYSGTGNVKFNTGNYNEAVDHLFKALKIFENHHLEKNAITCLQYIGMAYNEQNILDKAMNYSEQALKSAQKSRNKYQVGTSMMIIGSVYYSKDNFDMALDYFRQALHTMEEAGDKQGISDATNNVALIYEKKKEYPKALEFHLRSLKMFEELKDKRGIAASYNNIALVYISLQKYATAVNYLDSCIVVAKEVEQKYYLKVSYQTLAELYARMQKFDLAYRNHLLFSQINDTLLNEESKKQFAEMSTKYESEKKEKEINLLKSENEIQKLKAERSNYFNAALASGVIVLFALTFIYFNQSRKRRKMNIKLQQAYNDLANAQQKLIEHEKHALLGKLASRVAHEIQNPLNFVNGFSELTEELADEIARTKSEEERNKIIVILKENLSKINHHGKRADTIIKVIQKHLLDGSGIDFLEE